VVFVENSPRLGNVNWSFLGEAPGQLDQPIEIGANHETAPVLGIALAGRAASVLREVATWFDGEGVAVPMPAMTIHRGARLNIPISDI
jgi:hypothetical protein